MCYAIRDLGEKGYLPHAKVVNNQLKGFDYNIPLQLLLGTVDASARAQSIRSRARTHCQLLSPPRRRRREKKADNKNESEWWFFLRGARFIQEESAENYFLRW